MGEEIHRGKLGLVTREAGRAAERPEQGVLRKCGGGPAGRGDVGRAEAGGRTLPSSKAVVLSSEPVPGFWTLPLSEPQDPLLQHASLPCPHLPEFAQIHVHELVIKQLVWVLNTFDSSSSEEARPSPPRTFLELREYLHLMVSFGCSRPH